MGDDTKEPTVSEQVAALEARVEELEGQLAQAKARGDWAHQMLQAESRKVADARLALGIPEQGDPRGSLFALQDEQARARRPWGFAAYGPMLRGLF